MAKNYTHPTYEDVETLNKTIENIKEAERATDYILKHYESVIGRIPNINWLCKEKNNMKRHLYKDREFIKLLKKAISYLNYISLDVYLEDFKN